MESSIITFLPIELVRYIILPYAWGSHVDHKTSTFFQKHVMHELLHKYWNDMERVINANVFPNQECCLLYYYGHANDDRVFPKPCHYHVVVRHSLEDHFWVRSQFLKDDGDSIRFWIPYAGFLHIYSSS